jgi:hypothetical protein
MGSPEPKQGSRDSETDDLDFAWDDSFPIRQPPRPSSEVPVSASGPPPHPRSRAASSHPPPSVSGLAKLPPLDSSPAIAIDDLPELIEARPRETMITLTDEDPLRHDVGYSKDRDVTRDSMPTIPDINPLRYDVASDAEAAPEPSVPPTSRSRNPA